MSLKDATVLAIDDDTLNLIIIDEYLAHLCGTLLLESDAHAALVLAQEKKPDIILLDILMRDVDGYELCRQLKANTITQHIPVIFLSTLKRAVDKVKGFDVGGVDYISKPFEFEEMRVRIESCLKTHEKINKKNEQIVNNFTKKINYYRLTPQEISILRWYALGHQRSEIAEQLFISENTVKWHLKNILIKLGVSNRSQATEKARDMGII